MKKTPLRRSCNRLLHALARSLPGGKRLRPALHRLRGMKVGSNVFIADEVYLDNEYPERIEIRDGVQLSIRAMIIAHTRGPGRIIIEEDAHIGPNAVVVTSHGRTVTIGKGAVIGAGVTITQNVAPGVLLVNPPIQPVARVLVPLGKAEDFEAFVRGLAPLERSKQPDV